MPEDPTFWFWAALYLLAGVATAEWALASERRVRLTRRLDLSGYLTLVLAWPPCLIAAVIVYLIQRGRRR